MNNISYRDAQIEDCYLIAKLKGDVWNTTYRGIYTDQKIDNYDIKKNRAKFEKIVLNPDIASYVAVSKQQIVGFMSCGKPQRPFQDFQQEIGLLYILKEYQRKGIGKDFFSIAAKKIKSNGYNEFFISVNKYNLNALNFYIAMGGQIIHIDDDKDKEDKSEVQIKLLYKV